MLQFQTPSMFASDSDRPSRLHAESRYPVVALSAHHWRPERHSSGVVAYTTHLVDGIKRLNTPVYVIANQGTLQPGDDFVRLVPSWSKLPRGSTEWLKGGLGRRLAPDYTRSWMMARRLLYVVRGLHRMAGIRLLETEESCGVARFVCRGSPVPVVVRVHGPWFLVGPAAGAQEGRIFDARVRAEGSALNAAAGLSAPSRDVLRRVEVFYQRLFRDAAIIPNPVQPVPECDQWSLAECERDRLLFVGRFDRAKGADLILDAFARILRVRPTVRLTMVGLDNGIVDFDGTCVNVQEYVKRMFPNAAQAARIEWLGLRSPEEILALRQTCFACVVASRYESFSMVTLEALAAGCPLVAPNVGGIAEIVQHESNGLLFRSEDAADLAGKLVHLMRHPAYAAKLGAQAAMDATINYNPVTIARRTLEFHQEVLARSEYGSSKGICSRIR